MRTYLLAASLVLGAVAACSDDASPSASSGNDGGSPIVETNDGSVGTPADAAPSDGGDAGSDAECPAAWTTPLAVDPTLAVPADGGSVIFHAAANGTQNYACQSALDAGATTYAWVFTGPEADLSDCAETTVGKHFANGGNAATPEWQTTDGTYVIGKKVAAFTPDGGASSVPWLLLAATSTAGAGVLAKTAYVQRLNTDGGVAPAAAACAAGNVGTVEKVPYTADYYFSGSR